MKLHAFSVMVKKGKHMKQKLNKDVETTRKQLIMENTTKNRKMRRKI